MGLAACGSDKSTDTNIDAPTTPQDAPADSKVFMDAPPPSYDFSCMGNAAPTAATATITLSGNVQQLDLQGMTPSTTPVDGASVAMCKDTSMCSGGNLIQIVFSDTQGTFSSQTSEGNSLPLNVHLKIFKAASTVRTTYVFPPSPFVADQPGIPVLSFGSGLMSALTLACGQNDVTNAIVALIVTDCAGKPITDTTNVKVAIKQGGSAVNSVSVLDLGSVAAQFAGTFLVCNVPAANATNAGATTVGATYKTMALKDNIVRVATGSTTQTIVRPGY